jgi:hypothetical protein
MKRRLAFAITLVVFAEWFVYRVLVAMLCSSPGTGGTMAAAEQQCFSAFHNLIFETVVAGGVVVCLVAFLVLSSEDFN